MMNVKQRQALQNACSELNAMNEDSDTEAVHSEAENILCKLLEEIGYGEASKAFRSARERVGFWYA